MQTVPASTATHAEKFVDVTGKMALVMAALGIVYCVLQLAVIVVAGWFEPRAWLAEHAISLPPGLDWLAEHATALGVGMLLLSVLFLAVSWGLYRRQEWARVGFIAFLLVVGLANFASVPLIDAVFSGMLAMIPAELHDAPEMRESLQQMQVSRWVTLLMCIVTSVAFAVLHLWLAIKLGRPEVRACFGRNRAH